jgi:hypothetical protein
MVHSLSPQNLSDLIVVHPRHVDVYDYSVEFVFSSTIGLLEGSPLRPLELLVIGGFVLGRAVFLRFGGLTMVFQGASVKDEVAPTSFRFPETKSAHLKFSPLSDNNLWRLKCLHAMSLFI